MPNQLSRTLESFFDPSIMRRGNDYFRRDLIEVQSCDGQIVTAEAHGSMDYSLSLDFSKPAVVNAYCSCPYFEEGDACKHLWALILKIETHSLVEIKGPIGSFELLGEAPQAAKDWKRLFRQNPETPEAESSTVAIILSSSVRSEVKFEIFSLSTKKNGTHNLKRLRLKPYEPFKHKDAKIQAAVRTIFTLSAANRWHYSYDYERFVNPDGLSLVLTEILATQRVFLNQADALASAKQDGLNLTSASLQKFQLLAELSSNGGLQIKASLIIQDSQGTTHSLLLDKIEKVSESLYRADRSLFWLRLSESETLWFVELSSGSLQVHAEEVSAFLAEVYASGLQIQLPKELELEQKTTTPLFSVNLEQGRQHAFGYYHFDLRFQYGNHLLSFLDERTQLASVEEQCIYLRNPDFEKTIIDKIPKRFLRYLDNFLVVPSKDLFECASELIKEGFEVKVQNRSLQVSSSFKTDVRSGLDWFEVDTQVGFSGRWVQFPRILAAVRRGETFLPLEDGSLGLIDEETKIRLERLAAFGDPSEEKLRFGSSQALLLNTLIENHSEVRVDKVFKELQKKIKNFAGLEPAKPTVSFKGDLRPYQQEGLSWLGFLQDFGLGGILADDMGLGKTIQCLAFLEGRRKKKEHPFLLVAPKSLLENWRSEAARFTPLMRIYLHRGQERTRDIKELQGFDMIITTYQTLFRDIELFRQGSWDAFIADEAQAIKNPQSLTSKACKLVPAKFRLAMTGTPVENSINDLFSISEFVNPGFLSSKKSFSAADLSAASKEAISKSLRPIILRRTKDQVLKDLPAKIEQTLRVTLDAKQQRVYNELKLYYQAQVMRQVDEDGIKKSQIQILAALTRLRQVALHPGLVSDQYLNYPSAKLEALLEMLKEIIAENHRVLVFSQFTSLLAFVQKLLKKNGIPFCYLDGQTKNRQEEVESYRNSDVPVFLMSLKAGGVGLNLVEAGYVILLDPWWNPAVEAQAIDRAHRIGQTKVVNAYRLIAAGTVEEKILELQDSKRALAKNLIGDNKGMGSLTKKDLEFIFS